MRPTRIAVIGGGRLGAIHARLLKDVPDAELAVIVEPRPEARETLAAQHDVLGLADWRQALPHIDAAICAAPTLLHEEIGTALLRRGVPVLMEKPLAHTPQAAARLCQAAREGRTVLQVGHVERFNPALRTVAHQLRNPRMLVAERTSGYTFRSTDVGVVLDLMIHDIDIVLSLHGGKVREVRAVGAPVLGPHEDWAHAHLVFEDGAIASLSASRVQGQACRRLRVACQDVLGDLDFSTPSARLIQPSSAVLSGAFAADGLTAQQIDALRDGELAKELPVSAPELPPTNAILEEQRDFVSAIRQGGAPRVTGYDGLRAVEIADRVLANMAPADTLDVIPWPKVADGGRRKVG